MKKNFYVKPETDILRTETGTEFELCENISDESGDGTDLAKTRNDDEYTEEEEEFLEFIAAQEQQQPLW